MSEIKWMGKRIKELAFHKKITIAALADKVGVARQNVYRWVRGDCPSAKRLIQLSIALDARPESFFFIPRNKNFLKKISESREVKKPVKKKAKKPVPKKPLRDCNGKKVITF